MPRIYPSAILLSATLVSSTLLAQELPKLTIKPQWSVSGLSSGGYMAAQFHLAFSRQVQAAGIIAAGPVYCAKNSLVHALDHCLGKDSSSPELALAYLQAQQDKGSIDALNELKDDRVWLFHGTLDKTIHRKVMDALHQQYQAFIPENQLSYQTNSVAAHHFPTIAYGSACDISETPFLGACQQDIAGTMLSHLLGALSPRSTQTSGQLIKFSQHHVAPAAVDQLAEYGYVYVPKACEHGKLCRLHISFHGCKQNEQFVGDVFAKQTGLNEYADTNALVVLYPQTKTSMMAPMNPQGCWDWWGYSSDQYATKQGPQMQAVFQLGQALSMKP